MSATTTRPDQQVLIDDVPRSIGWLFGTVEGQRLLETAYGQNGAVIRCMCTSERLRLHPYRTGSGTIELRCDDFSGPRHAPDCFRHGEITPYRQRVTRFQRAVKFDDDTNVYSISLRHSLELRPSLETKPKRPKARGTTDPDPSEVRGSIGLSTYLKFLTQTSELHGNLAANFPELPADFCRGLASARSRNVINGLPGASVVLLAGVDDLQEFPRLQAETKESQVCGCVRRAGRRQKAISADGDVWGWGNRTSTGRTAAAAPDQVVGVGNNRRSERVSMLPFRCKAAFSQIG